MKVISDCTHLWMGGILMVREAVFLAFLSIGNAPLLHFHQRIPNALQDKKVGPESMDWEVVF